MRGNKLIVPVKAVAFAIKGNLPDDIKLERLRLFLQQEATRTGSSFDVDGRVLQGLDSNTAFFFYNGPKGLPLALPEIPPLD